MLLPFLTEINLLVLWSGSEEFQRQNLSPKELANLHSSQRDRCFATRPDEIQDALLIVVLQSLHCARISLAVRVQFSEFKPCCNVCCFHKPSKKALSSKSSSRSPGIGQSFNISSSCESILPLSIIEVWLSSCLLRFVTLFQSCYDRFVTLC